jgi:hypothetical protein
VDRRGSDGLSFPQTHTDRLATLARIFGISAPDVTACRVLELGCASDGSVYDCAASDPKPEAAGSNPAGPAARRFLFTEEQR